MLNNKKRNLIGLGAIVGTVGLVSAIAIPLALRTTADSEGSAVMDLSGTLSDKQQKVKDAATATAVAALGNKYTGVTVKEVTLSKDGTTQRISGEMTAVRRKRSGSAAATKAINEFTLTIVLSEKASTKATLMTTVAGTTKTEEITDSTLLATITTKASVVLVTFKTATGEVPSTDTGTGTGSGDNTGTGTGSGDNTGTGTGTGTTTTALALGDTQLKAMVDATTGVIDATAPAAAHITIARTSELPAAGAGAKDVTYSVTPMSGYSLGTTSATFTVSVTIAAVAPTKTDWTEQEVLTSVAADAFESKVAAVIKTHVTTSATADPKAADVSATAFTITLTLVGDAHHNSTDVTVSVTLAAKVDTIDTTAGSMDVTYTADKGSYTGDITVKGWQTSDPDILALNGITGLVADIKSTVTKLDKLASDIVEADIKVPATGSDGISYAATAAHGDDSTQTVTVTITATKNSKTKEFPGLTITGFAQVATEPHAADITGIAADAAGTALTGGTAPAHVVLGALPTVTAGATTADVTVTPAAGYLWADGSKDPKTITGVHVDQAAWTKAESDKAAAALAKAKTDAIKAVSDAAGTGTEGTKALEAAKLAINAASVDTIEKVTALQTTHVDLATKAKTADDATAAATADTTDIQTVVTALGTSSSATATAPIAEVAAEADFDATAAGVYGVTMPTLNGTTLKYTATGIDHDGDITLTIKVSKGTGTTATVSITVGVTGIDAEKLKTAKTDAIAALEGAPGHDTAQDDTAHDPGLDLFKEIAKAIADGKTAINAADTPAKVETAKTDAITALDTASKAYLASDAPASADEPQIKSPAPEVVSETTTGSYSAVELIYA